MKSTQITVNQITAEKIVFNVIEHTVGMFGDDTRTKQVEMPLTDVAKIINAINKYCY